MKLKEITKKEEESKILTECMWAIKKVLLTAKSPMKITIVTEEGTKCTFTIKDEGVCSSIISLLRKDLEVIKNVINKINQME